MDAHHLLSSDAHAQRDPFARVRVRVRVDAVAVAVVLGTFTTYRLWQAFAGEPRTWTDTADYARSAVWAGTRPPLIPLLLGLTGTPSWFVAAQALAAVAAWGGLAWVVGALVSPRVRVAAVAVVLAFASTTPVVQWDRSVLSESLALSTTALLVAAGLWLYSCSFTWPRVLAFVAAAVTFASVRDLHVWIVWVLAAGVGVEAVARERGRRGVVAALVLAACAGVLLGGSLDADRSQVTIEHAYFARIFPYPERVAWFEQRGMPDADAVRRYARAVEPRDGAAPIVALAANDPAVQPLLRWLRDEGAVTYAHWLLEHPWYVVSEPLREPERAYNFAEGHISYYAVDGRTELAPLDALLYPTAWVVAIIGGAAVAVGMMLGSHRRSWWWFIVAVGALGVVHMLLAWHGDGMETTRHVSVGNVQVRLAVTLLAIVAADHFARRRTPG